MCLAYPGKIKSIEGEHAIVDFSGVKRKTNIAFIKARVGDYVIVHAGFAIEILDEKAAKKSLEILEN